MSKYSAAYGRALLGDVAYGSGRHAWVVFLILGGLNLLDGLELVLLGAAAERDALVHATGMTWNELLISSPRVASYINNLTVISGFFLLGFSLFVIVVAATAFRLGRRWAWYVMWYVPAYYLFTAYILFGEGELLSPDALTGEILLLLLVASVVAQLFAFDGFFRTGRKGVEAPSLGS